jgi:hypothetical protein
MSSIPNSRGVNQSIEALRGSVRKAIKGVNQKAGAKMAKGDYAAAETLAGRGRELQQFFLEVDTLRKRWREVRSGRKTGQKKNLTPLWGFYQPILKALHQLGGEATAAEIEPAVERIMESMLLPGDRARLSGGRERWKVVIRWTRKHLVEEEWLENRKGATWRITDAGRRAADKMPAPPQP